MFSVSVNEMGGIFNYPIFCFLMKKRTKKHHNDEILNFMKNVYFTKFQENLEIKAIHVDCERPFILSVEENFPKTSVVLCSIHIIRAILRNFRSKVDPNFFTDPILLEIWRVITGALYLDL